jgi:hypothetical protein
MLKLIIAAAIAIGAFVPSTASAGGAGYHGRHHGHHHHRHFHRHHWAPRYVLAGCWRWVPTRYGYAKLWVCG